MRYSNTENNVYVVFLDMFSTFDFESGKSEAADW